MIDLGKSGSPSVITAAKILNLLKEERENGLGLSEIHRSLGLPKSSVFGVLKALLDVDYVALDPVTKRYRLSWGLAVVGIAATAGMDHLSKARSYLQPFSKENHLACIVSRRIGDSFVIVETIEPTGYVKVAVTLGSSRPLQYGSTGRVFLAFDTPSSIDAYLSENRLIQYTPRTITDRAAVKQELARIRMDGLAISQEDYQLGVNSVAAPIFGPDGSVVLAISALDFASALGSDRLDWVGARIKEIAEKITAAIGGHKPNGLS